MSPNAASAAGASPLNVAFAGSLSSAAVFSGGTSDWSLAPSLAITLNVGTVASNGSARCVSVLSASSALTRTTPTAPAACAKYVK